MINFADRAKNPSFATSKAVLNILQTHYPERLGHALILNVPWMLNAFFKLITPLVDPRTRVKMKFNPNPVQDGLFAPEQLFIEGGWGGEVDFQWDHAKYWPALIRLCAEIREKELERWRTLGARVGLSEWDIKSESVSAAEETVTPALPVAPPVTEMEAEVAATTDVPASAAVAETIADTQTVPESVAPTAPEAGGQA